MKNKIDEMMKPDLSYNGKVDDPINWFFTIAAAIYGLAWVVAVCAALGV